MLTQKKIQIDESEWDFIEKAVSIFNYKSKSEYMRQAILEKIRQDKAKLREMKRQQAMLSCAENGWENIFEDLEGDDFEDR